jgi:hypothetical protein
VFAGTFDEGWYTLPNVAFALAAPIMLSNREFPHGTNQALQISLPVSVMVAVCSISIGLSIQESNCVWFVFLADDGKIAMSKVMTALLLPIPAMFTIWVIVTSCNGGRVVDIGIMILTMASLRLIETNYVPTVLACTGMLLLLSSRLYNRLNPPVD